MDNDSPWWLLVLLVGMIAPFIIAGIWVRKSLDKMWKK